MLRLGIAAFITLALTACSMPMHYFTFPPGHTQRDFERDVRVCNADAQTLQWNTWFGGRTDGQVDRRFVACMTTLGYRERATPP